MNYAKHLKSTQTEQDRSDQIQNAAGGFVFKIDKWARLERFLVLGTVGRTTLVSTSLLGRTPRASPSA